MARRAPSPLDAIAGAAYEVAGLLFDPDAGAGATPNHKSTGYLGFVALMTPREFLSLSPPLEHRRAKTDAYLAGLPPMAPPQLYVDVQDERLDQVRVRNHEGRHRSSRLVELGAGDEPIQVHVYPSHGLRGRDYADVSEVVIAPGRTASPGAKPVRARIHRKR